MERFLWKHAGCDLHSSRFEPAGVMGLRETPRQFGKEMSDPPAQRAGLKTMLIELMQGRVVVEVGAITAYCNKWKRGVD